MDPIRIPHAREAFQAAQNKLAAAITWLPLGDPLIDQAEEAAARIYRIDHELQAREKPALVQTEVGGWK